MILVRFQVFSSLMWPGAAVLDNVGLEHFHHPRTFYWTALVLVLCPTLKAKALYTWASSFIIHKTSGFSDKLFISSLHGTLRSCDLPVWRAVINYKTV